MRKCLSLFILIGYIMLLASCVSSDELKPIKEETNDFSLVTATKMIEEKEKLIIELASKETLTSTEYIEFETAIKEAFGEHSYQIFTIFVIEYENKIDLESYTIQQDTLYPTVFHRDIEITDAVITKITYGNEFFNETYLTITEKYTGKDSELKDWEREYIFIEDEKGEWELHSVSGDMNFLGEEYSMNYLEMK